MASAGQAADGPTLAEACRGEPTLAWGSLRHALGPKGSLALLDRPTPVLSHCVRLCRAVFDRGQHQPCEEARHALLARGELGPSQTGERYTCGAASEVVGHLVRGRVRVSGKVSGRVTVRMRGRVTVRIRGRGRVRKARRRLGCVRRAGAASVPYVTAGRRATRNTWSGVGLGLRLGSGSGSGLGWGLGLGSGLGSGLGLGLGVRVGG